MGRLLGYLRRIWKATDHFQTALGVPTMWTTVSTGAAAVSAAIVPLALHWKLVLFIVLTLGFIWIVVGVYAIFFFERFDRTRRLRSIFKDAGARLAALGTVNYSSSDGFSKALNNQFIEVKCDILVFMALKHWAAKDYDDYIDVAESRAKQSGHESIKHNSSEFICSTLAIDSHSI